MKKTGYISITTIICTVANIMENISKRKPTAAVSLPLKLPGEGGPWEGESLPKKR